ncbi:hypothetical protein IQ243_09560 [Nostocales cyanobacterium LEGE 11386]|nr:hypothetical protein [Nostocales cyanobacterium LEGE 11386]
MHNAKKYPVPDAVMEENKPKSYSFFSLQRLPVALHLLALSSTPKSCRDSSLQALSEYQRPAEELQVKSDRLFPQCDRR